GEMKTAPQLLAEVIERMQEMDGQTRIAAASALFGTEAMSGMLEVIDAGPDKLNKLTEALRNSEGASAKAAKQMKDNLDRKSTRLNSSHVKISYAVFCLKKKKPYYQASPH